MRTRGLVLLVAAAAPLLAAVPGTASAADPSVLTNTRVGGPAVRVGAILKAALRGKATLIIPGTTRGISCSSASVTDRVTRNPAAPGTAQESLTGQTFSRCSTTIPGTTGVRSITVLGLPYRTTISDSRGNPVIIFNASTRLTLNTVLGPLTCTYRAARLRGTAVNTGQTIVFVRQPFSLSSGSTACPRSGSFSAIFGPVTNTSVSGRPRVFVS